MIFTPTESAHAIAVLTTECSVPFVDCSFGGDIDDSISYAIGDSLLVVHFPNVYGREAVGIEENTHFCAYVDRGNNPRVYLYNKAGSDCFTLEEAVVIINEFIASLHCIKKWEGN